MYDGNEQGEFLADLHKAINKEYTVSDDGKCPNCVDAIMCDDVKKLF